MPIIAFTQTWAFPWRSGMAGMLTARARRVSIAGTFQVLLVQFAFEVWTFVGTVGFRIHVHFYNFKMGVLLCDVMGLLRAQLSRKICTMHNSFTFFNRIATSYEYLMHIAKRIWASSRNCICNLTNPLHWGFFSLLNTVIPIWKCRTGHFTEWKINFSGLGLANKKGNLL